MPRQIVDQVLFTKCIFCGVGLVNDMPFYEHTDNETALAFSDDKWLMMLAGDVVALARHNLAEHHALANGLRLPILNGDRKVLGAGWRLTTVTELTDACMDDHSFKD